MRALPDTMRSTPTEGIKCLPKPHTAYRHASRRHPPLPIGRKDGPAPTFRLPYAPFQHIPSNIGYGPVMVGTNTFFTLDEARHTARTTQIVCRRAIARTKRPLVFSHITALRLAGMNLDLRTTLDPNRLHVTIPSTRCKSRLTGVQHHVWRQEMSYAPSPDELITMVTPQQAICQMAQFTGQDSLTMAMDRMTCHNPKLRLCTHAELGEYIAGLGRFTGAVRCRAAFYRSVEGTDSPQETRLRLGLVDFGLPTPMVNHAILDHEDGTTWLVDMAYAEERIAIEYDGEYHYDKSRWRSDLHKRNRLQHLGWKVLVATKRDLSSPKAIEDFAAMTAKSLGRGRRGGAAYGHADR